MRVFEIRWLDLRIVGLIEQRETCLKQIGDMCTPITRRVNSRGSSRDPINTATVTTFNSYGNFESAAFRKLLIEQIQIYRTLSLYVAEYIVTWKSKQFDKLTYNWRGIDYLVKMATDFKQLCEKNKKLTQFLEQKNLEASPLVIPRNPHLYHQYYQKMNNKRKNMVSFSTEEDDNESTASIDSFLRVDENDEMDHVDVPGAGLASGRTSQLNNIGSQVGDFNEQQVQQEVQSQDDDFHTKSASRPQTGRFGKINKFSSTLDQEVDEGFFITETSVGKIPMNKIKQTETLSSTLNNQTRKKNGSSEILEDIQLQMSLPPLLVHQHYNDRSRRHKKYSEPLVTIRHEDLLDELEAENPHMAYKGKPLINKSKELLSGQALSENSAQRSVFVAPIHSIEDTLRNLDDQSKIHKVSLKSTKKALMRARTHSSSDNKDFRSDSNGFGRSETADMLNNKLSDMGSNRNTNNIRQGTYIEKEEKDEMDFHAPNLAQDIERLKRAQLMVLEHVKLQEQLNHNLQQ